MKKIIKKFNYSTFSFQGHSLIEASAGTGKTYIIAMLYLRLLLGIHNRRLQPLTIKNILLVTFTNMAAEELRIRIRNNIHEFRLACMIGYSHNIFFSELLKKIDDMHFVYRQLLAAEQNISSVQIFTIHGFCQRILDMCPIELNSILRYHILKDEKPLFKRACNDFWRYYFYPLPIEITRIIEEYWSGPENLFEEIYPYLYNVTINIQPHIRENDIVRKHEHIIGYINYVKKIWCDIRNNLLEIIGGLSINRHVYNPKNLKNWFEKIDFWANKEITKDYKIPKELKRFGYLEMVHGIKVQERYMLQYPLFKAIDKLFKKILTLKQLILNIAIYEIRKIVKDIKNISSEISFNDLIYLLDNALCHSNQGKKLAQLICEHYPVAIIDEFQDTDFNQYRIFYTLYSLYSSKYGLLLIGDPKQSIYSFRGADIFSYLSARKNVDSHYTLDTNWRSSRGMVNAINTLFQFNSSFPFVFQDIPFIPMNVAKHNQQLSLIVEGRLCPAIHFWLPAYSKITLREYQKIMAYQCVNTILDLLDRASHDTVWLHYSNNKRLLRESDIVILVRDRHEGSLISSILEEFNINSICLFTQKNIFKTREASDLLLILQAVLAPENANLLRCALMTNLIGYDAKKIDIINQSEEEWKKEIEEFTKYYFFWKKYDLKTMLQEIIFHRSTLKNISYTQEGERCLINILHLGEILQKKLMELNNESLLVYWLNTKINTPTELCSDDQLLRSQNFDHRSIRIITIHRAKGLEFPLVFLPFIPTRYMKRYPLFHNRKDHQIYLDLSNSLENFKLSEEERLSEDLRLFYVAITRAIYYCFIGIGAVFFKKSKIRDYSDLHHTALGHLVQNGIPGDFEFLQKCLKTLVKQSNGDIIFNFVVENQCRQPLMSKLKTSNNNYVLEKKSLSARNWKSEPIITLYKVSSYTELHRFSTSYSTSSTSLKQNIINFENNEIKKSNGDSDLFTPHTFPRGNVSGKFLHYIFQKWNFKEKIDDEWLMIKLSQNGIDMVWLSVIKNWINIIINIPLDNKDLILSKLSSVNCSSEWQFYLSINNLISAEELDEICKNYDPISRLSSNLKFPNIIGMLHGFVDLVFFWKGKYYLLDYKSNWLGKTYDSYDFLTIQHEMIVQNYALQYQIYTLALHRFLRHRLVQYDYEKDFGGVYYLFLRGMNLLHPGKGIYFCRPKKLFIDKLDQLLSDSYTSV